MEFKINNKRTIFIAIAFAIVLYWGLNNHELLFRGLSYVIGICSPIILGGAIAFVLNVPLRFFEKYLGKVIKGKQSALRFTGIILSYALAIGIIVFVIMTVIPEMVNTVKSLNQGFPQFIDQLDGWVKGLAKNYPDITDYISKLEVNWPSIVERVLGVLQSGVTNVLSSTLGVATSVIGVLTTIMLGVIFSIYILAQKEKLGTQFRKILYAYLPQGRADRITEIGHLTSKTFTGFISGQCMEALLFGILCYIGMLIFNFPYAISISVLIGFTTLIPVLGAFIGTGLGALLILVTNPIKALWFVVFIIVLQQIDEHFMYPRVVGTSVGLPSLWVMIAVTLGGSLMGLFGMLVFVPLVSVFYALFRESVYGRLKKRAVPEVKYIESVGEKIEKSKNQK